MCLWCPRASATCDGFGFTRKTAAPFDVFYWLQVTNFDPLFDSGVPSGADHLDVLFDSAPKGANHFAVYDLGIHAKCPPDWIALDWLYDAFCSRFFSLAISALEFARPPVNEGIMDDYGGRNNAEHPNERPAWKQLFSVRRDSSSDETGNSLKAVFESCCCRT
jgi:hypothetical protein